MSAAGRHCSFLPGTGEKYKTSLLGPALNGIIATLLRADVAQLVEQRFRKP
jgi:hypothetical protein